MAKMIYTVAEVPGSKRCSDAVYTHALIGQFDPTMVAAHYEVEHKANLAKNIRWETKNWNDRKRCAETPAGQRYINHNGYSVEQSQGMRDISLKFMEENPTLGDYFIRLEQQHRDLVAQTLAKPLEAVTVLQWSRSAANAAKGISKYRNYYRGLKVVPVVRVK